MLRMVRSLKADNLETATRRSTRLLSLPASDIALTKVSASNSPSVDGSDFEFPEPSKIGKDAGRARMVKDEGSRASLSSVATSHDYNESSGYSTPGTSTFVTPAPAKRDLAVPTSLTQSVRRPRRAAATAMLSSPDAVSAAMRAVALRNSQFSLDPASFKRKRPVIPDSENDDDLDADDDNSADAQLARALQKQEDEAAMAMDEPSSFRRSPRNTRSIRPKSYPILSMKVSDDDDDSFGPATKKPKVVLRSDGGNSISFSANKPKPKTRPNIIMDSDDSNEFLDIDESEDDEPISKSAVRARMRRIIASQSKTFESAKQVPLHPQIASSQLAPTSTESSSTTVVLATSDRLTRVSSSSSALSSVATPNISDTELDSDVEIYSDGFTSDDDSSDDGNTAAVSAAGGSLSRQARTPRAARQRTRNLEERLNTRAKAERARLESHHPELHTMWKDLENLPKIGSVTIDQPTNISRELKPFQLEGVAWMKAMEKTEWAGGLLGDEMGMGKTIQAVSLIMSDFPAPQPSLVLIPPVALMQWQQEIADYTDGTLKTFVFHGTNTQTKGVTVKELRKYNVILMSYNSLESMYRKQEKGFKRKTGIHKEASVIHQIQFHRVILDEAHNIKVKFSIPINSNAANIQ